MLIKKVEIEEKEAGKSRGLCENCIHSKDCMYCTGKNVISCEEFETNTPKKVIRKVHIKPIKPAEKETKPLHKERKLQGLCVNCESRFTCKNCNV
ncbi:MAG: hypothetical protein PHV06_06740, partial [bacterium]|nr:hypothetical protein [bacterium]